MTEEHVREGLEHLQAAAVEIIGAMRAFLGAAEALIRDPSDVLSAVNDLAETARIAAGQVARYAASPTAGPSGDQGSQSEATRVTRVPVS